MNTDMDFELRSGCLFITLVFLLILISSSFMHIKKLKSVRSCEINFYFIYFVSALQLTHRELCRNKAMSMTQPPPAIMIRWLAERMLSMGEMTHWWGYPNIFYVQNILIEALQGHCKFKRILKVKCPIVELSLPQMDMDRTWIDRGMDMYGDMDLDPSRRNWF